MDKNVNAQPQAASSPKFSVELRSKSGEVLIHRENIDFSVVTAFFAVMSDGQYVAVSSSPFGSFCD